MANTLTQEQVDEDMALMDNAPGPRRTSTQANSEEGPQPVEMSAMDQAEEEARYEAMLKERDDAQAQEQQAEVAPIPEEDVEAIIDTAKEQVPAESQDSRSGGRYVEEDVDTSVPQSERMHGIEVEGDPSRQKVEVRRATIATPEEKAKYVRDLGFTDRLKTLEHNESAFQQQVARDTARALGAPESIRQRELAKIRANALPITEWFKNQKSALGGDRLRALSPTDQLRVSKMAQDNVNPIHAMDLISESDKRYAQAIELHAQLGGGEAADRIVYGNFVNAETGNAMNSSGQGVPKQNADGTYKRIGGLYSVDNYGLTQIANPSKLAEVKSKTDLMEKIDDTKTFRNEVGVGAGSSGKSQLQLKRDDARRTFSMRNREYDILYKRITNDEALSNSPSKEDVAALEDVKARRKDAEIRMREMEDRFDEEDRLRGGLPARAPSEASTTQPEARGADGGVELTDNEQVNKEMRDTYTDLYRHPENYTSDQLAKTKENFLEVAKKNNIPVGVYQDTAEAYNGLIALGEKPATKALIIDGDPRVIQWPGAKKWADHISKQDPKPYVEDNVNLLKQADTLKTKLDSVKVPERKRLPQSGARYPGSADDRLYDPETEKKVKVVEESRRKLQEELASFEFQIKQNRNRIAKIATAKQYLARK